MDCSLIVAVPGTSIAGHVQSEGDIDDYRYSAPEIRRPKYHNMEIEKESDVYGMGMVVYEASSHLPVSFCLMGKSHLDLLGLDWHCAVLQT